MVLIEEDCLAWRVLAGVIYIHLGLRKRPSKEFDHFKRNPEDLNS
jgi:hypothetical protein